MRPNPDVARSGFITPWHAEKPGRFLPDWQL
jgi:hypothetical protein